MPITPFFLAANFPWNFPEVLDYWDARYGVTSSGERVSAWVPSFKGVDSLDQASGAAQPILLPYSGTNYLWLSGVSGNHATTPNAAQNQITGDLAFVCKIAANDYTPSVLNFLGSKWQGGGARSWSFYMNTNGTLEFNWSTDGTNAAGPLTSSVATGITDFAEKYCAVSIDADNGASNGEAKFFLSDDGVTFTQLGTTRQHSTTISLFNANAPVQIGTQASGGQVFAGKFFNASLYSGIPPILGGSGSTAPVLNANFTAVPEGATSFTESSSNGATVTINSTGAKPAQIVARPWILGDAAAYFLQSTFTLPAPYAICAVVQFNTWASADVLFDGKTANSFAAQQITGTPQIRMHDGSADTSTVSPTLKTRYILYASQAAGGATRFRLNLGTAVTGTMSATALAGLTALADGAGANHIGAQIAAISVLNSVPSVALEEQFIRAVAAQSGISV